MINLKLLITSGRSFTYMKKQCSKNTAMSDLGDQLIFCSLSLIKHISNKTARAFSSNPKTIKLLKDNIKISCIKCLRNVQVNCNPGNLNQKLDRNLRPYRNDWATVDCCLPKNTLLKTILIIKCLINLFLKLFFQKKKWHKSLYLACNFKYTIYYSFCDEETIVRLCKHRQTVER